MFISLEQPHKTKAKFLLIFIVSLGIPSLILGYLAFRGIQNDRAVAKQEILEQNQKAARVIIDVVKNVEHTS